MASGPSRVVRAVWAAFPWAATRLRDGSAVCRANQRLVLADTRAVEETPGSKGRGELASESARGTAAIVDAFLPKLIGRRQ